MYTAYTMNGIQKQMLYFDTSLRNKHFSKMHKGGRYNQPEAEL